MQELIKLIILFAVGQGFFLAVFLFFQKNNKYANRVYSVIVILLSIELLFFHYLYINKSLEFPHFFIMFYGTSLLAGPLFLFYIGILVNHFKKFKWYYLLHFIPYILFTLILADYAFELEKEQAVFEIKKSYFSPEIKVTDVDFIIEIVILFYLGVYILYTKNILNKYLKRIKNYFSDIEKVQLIWLQIFIWSILTLWVIGFAAFILILYDVNLSNQFGYFYYSGIMILLYLTGYFMIFQKDIYKTASQINSNTENKNKNRKYLTSGLTSTMIEKYADKLKTYLKEHRVYQEQELTMNDLANKTGLTAHNISQVLNTKFNQNFYYFINSYRINDAKILLSNPKQAEKTILEIAFEVGFNSKATFNRIFKELTGTTPSAFRKKSL